MTTATTTLRIRQATDQYLLDLPNGDHWSLFPEADGDPAVLRKHRRWPTSQVDVGPDCPPVFPEWVLTGSDWDTDLCCALYTLGQPWETRPTILCAGSGDEYRLADAGEALDGIGHDVEVTCDVCDHGVVLTSSASSYLPDHDTEGELA